MSVKTTIILIKKYSFILCQSNMQWATGRARICSIFYANVILEKYVLLQGRIKAIRGPSYSEMKLCAHGRRQRGAGRGAVSPSWIFKYGTNIVDRGLKVLFFGHFYYFSVFFSLPPSWKRLNSAIFRTVFPSAPLPEKFSADALELPAPFNNNKFSKIQLMVSKCHS